MLHVPHVAALGVVCPELPRLIADHAATMPSDTVVAHHTLLFQGADNPGVVFDWHTDTAQENDNNDRGSGKAVLTAIHLLWVSDDYARSGMEVCGKNPVQYSAVGDTVVFAAHCVHRSVAPETGQCIKFVTTYAHNGTLPPSVQLSRTAKLFRAAQLDLTGRSPPSGLASMIYGVLKSVETENACFARAYNFMLLMAAGAMSMVPPLTRIESSNLQESDQYFTPIALGTMLKSTKKALGPIQESLQGCSRLAHAQCSVAPSNLAVRRLNIVSHLRAFLFRLYLGQDPFPPADDKLFTCDTSYTTKLANNISNTLQKAVRVYENLPPASGARTDFYVKHCMECFSIVQNNLSTKIPDKALKPGATEAISGEPNATCINRHSAIGVQLGSPSRDTCPRTQMHL